MRNTTILFIIIFFVSCSKINIKNNIEGVWVFENKVNNLYINETDDFFKHQLPIIYDFKKTGDLIVKNYSYKDTILKWEFKSDSIITIDNLEYSISQLNNEILNLVDYNSADTFHLTYRKPRNLKIDLSKKEIERILVSDIWSIVDTTQQRIGRHFEYFDNGTMIYRYKDSSLNHEGINDNLQLENWGVASYEDYFFLYNYRNMMLDNGNFEGINQIVEIDSLSYTLFVPSLKEEKVKFKTKKYSKDRKEAENKLKGIWNSKNLKSKTYGEHIPMGAIRDGIMATYEGDLSLVINDSMFQYQIKKFDPLKSKWKLGKDIKTLILEYKIDEPYRKGIHVDFADILELSDTKLKLRLYDNYYYTNGDKPRTYLLNLIQEFEKINNN